jgi:dienelactone hydrolase
MTLRKRVSLIAIFLVTLIAAGNSGCGGGSAATTTPPPPPPPPPSSGIAVGVGFGQNGIGESSSAIVQAGGTAQLTATVANDSANKGVTWSVACSPGPCGGVSPTSTLSSGNTTYIAPSTPPLNDLTVNITATSVTDPSASAFATADVPAITLSTAPRGALLPVNVTQQFAATVKNDPANNGVAWTLTQGGTACSPTCGKISSTSSASGTPITYAAPPTVLTSPTVTLTATSTTDTTKSTSTSITLSIGSVEIVPNSIDFGQVPKHHTSAPQTITLTNTAKTALTVSGVSLTGMKPASFSQTNTCAASVAAGASCTITVTFAGGAAATASVSISDSSVDSPQQVILSGNQLPSLANVAAVRTALANLKRASAPIPTGSSPVGTRVMSVIDTSREDPYLNNGTKRELLLRFWYPASLAQGCTLAEYTPPRIWSYFSELLGVTLPAVRTNSCQDAPIADGPHPVVIFTPGYTGTFTDYTFLLEDLASRGYVVASVDHTYEATALEFPDGRFIESVFGSNLGTYLRSDSEDLMFAVDVRLKDLEFVVNDLEGLNVSEGSPLAGKLDTSRVAIAGHSLGGMTAMLGVERTPALKVGINIDGGVPDGLLVPTETPVLILAAGRKVWSQNDLHMWDQLRGPRFAVNLKGAEHVTPSDALWLAAGAIKTGDMGPDKTIAAVRDYIAAFLDTNLLGKPANPLLTGPSSEYPDAEVTTQNELLPRNP